MSKTLEGTPLPPPSSPPSEAVAIAAPKLISAPGAGIRMVEYKLSSAAKSGLNVGSVEALEKAK